MLLSSCAPAMAVSMNIKAKIPITNCLRMGLTLSELRLHSLDCGPAPEFNLLPYAIDFQLGQWVRGVWGGKGLPEDGATKEEQALEKRARVRNRFGSTAWSGR